MPHRHLSPVPDRIDFVADLAANWARLGRTPKAERRVAILLANYPNRDGRIGNGVGYDTPASTLAILNALAEAGYRVDGIPASGNALIEALQAGPTNAAQRPGGAALPLDDYAKFLRNCRKRRETRSANAGGPGARPVCPRRRIPSSGARIRLRRHRHPAGPGLQYRPQGDLSRPRLAAAARLSRLLSVAA
jgi:cobalamin biosynthesis Mg chelatase CobN